MSAPATPQRAKITPEIAASGKRQLAKLCYEIGCSGLDKKCPGNPSCTILQKIARSQWAYDVIMSDEPERQP